MRSYYCHGNRNLKFVVVCLCLVIFHYSLRSNQLTDTGAIALATALQHNKSLEELKWVANWVSCYQEMWALNNMNEIKPLAMISLDLGDIQWYNGDTCRMAISLFHWHKCNYKLMFCCYGTNNNAMISHRSQTLFWGYLNVEDLSHALMKCLTSNWCPYR